MVVFHGDINFMIFHVDWTYHQIIMGLGVINHSMGGYYGDIDIDVMRYSQQPTIWFMIYIHDSLLTISSLQTGEPPFFKQIKDVIHPSKRDFHS